MTSVPPAAQWEPAAKAAPGVTLPEDQDNGPDFRAIVNFRPSEKAHALKAKSCDGVSAFCQPRHRKTSKPTFPYQRCQSPLEAFPDQTTWLAGNTHTAAHFTDFCGHIVQPDAYTVERLARRRFAAIGLGSEAAAMAAVQHRVR